MAATLRSRLLLSYGLIVAVLMGLFLVGSGISLLGNPQIYEGAALQLREAQRIINKRAMLLSAIPAANLANRVDRAGNQLNVRIVLLQDNGKQIADSQGATKPKLRTPVVRINTLIQRSDIGFLRDTTNSLWLGLAQPLESGTLVLAVPRPRLAVVQFFSNEIVRPVLLIGMFGLALAILIAILMAQWISAPLKHIGRAADEVASGRFQSIQPEGPAEVRSLAVSFNHMVRRVQDAQQSQRDLVANVSHELKTPLTSVQGYSQAILDGVSRSPEEIHQSAQVIYSESNRMNRLVQDLLTLARLEAGTADLRRAPVDISALVRIMAEKFQPQVAQSGLKLQVDAPLVLLVAGDEDRLVQVLSNLLDNAIKFTPSGGTVTISAQASGGMARIRVADTGMGIKPADHERVFERFYQASASRSGSGTGLGLAITRQIVLAHGGTIRVDDNSPRGSIFTVELPAI
jgi:signal transduction histidine kinase